MKQVVECYSGATYAERPMAVHWQGQRLDVEQVLRSWRTPDGPGFEVIVTGGQKLRLVYDDMNELWTVMAHQHKGCSERLETSDAYQGHHLAR